MITELGANLCAGCWADTTFITGAICNACGTPLLGEENEAQVKCDGSIMDPPKWNKGRAAVIYAGSGRRVVLSLKHSDRLDMARPSAEWMARAGAELLEQADVIVPVPLHWRRLCEENLTNRQSWRGIWRKFPASQLYLICWCALKIQRRKTGFPGRNVTKTNSAFSRFTSGVSYRKTFF